MRKINKAKTVLIKSPFKKNSPEENSVEEETGFFKMKLSTKIIVIISGAILLISSALIYLTAENYLGGSTWQIMLWGICGILSLYSIFARSFPALILNLILFAVVSFMPVWQTGYETVAPIVNGMESEK